MQIHCLSDHNSLLNTFLKEIRSKTIQKDSMRFRRNIERIAEILSYEMSKTLNFKEENISTPLAEASVQTIDESIVIATILRAGLPFHQGVMNYFDSAENAFVSAYRKYNANHTDFEIFVEYIASPDLNGKTLLLCDPMIATGGSIELSYKALLSKGTPAKTHVLGAIASKKALEHIKNQLPDQTEIWLAAIDPEIDEHSYIIPGLGDAGDLAFGTKL